MAIGGGGGGSMPPAPVVVDVEELGDWHLPLAFRQLQRAAHGAAQPRFATAALPAAPPAPAENPAAAIAAAAAAAQASAPASRASAAAERASHLVMGLLTNLEWPIDLWEPQVCVRVFDCAFLPYVWHTASLYD